jgi:hypothetical protein
MHCETSGRTRQEAIVIVVVTLEEATFLVAMYWIIRGIEVEDQLTGGYDRRTNLQPFLF